MISLYVLVEGATEKAFITRVLKPHLDARGIYTTGTTVTTKIDPRTGRRHKGGGDWEKWREDIVALLRNPGREHRITTLFDLYGLPSDFPEVNAHRGMASADRATQLEGAMARAIDDPRFMPYLQQHEFEALVLAGLEALAPVLEPSQQQGIRELRSALDGMAPEDVNERPQFCPSQRLCRSVRDYDKVVHGVQAVERAGLPTLRAACPRFDAWVTQLEAMR